MAERLAERNNDRLRKPSVFGPEEIEASWKWIADVNLNLETTQSEKEAVDIQQKLRDATSMLDERTRILRDLLSPLQLLGVARCQRLLISSRKKALFSRKKHADFLRSSAKDLLHVPTAQIPPLLALRWLSLLVHGTHCHSKHKVSLVRNQSTGASLGSALPARNASSDRMSARKTLLGENFVKVGQLLDAWFDGPVRDGLEVLRSRVRDLSEPKDVLRSRHALFSTASRLLRCAVAARMNADRPGFKFLILCLSDTVIPNSSTTECRCLLAAISSTTSQKLESLGWLIVERQLHLMVSRKYLPLVSGDRSRIESKMKNSEVLALAEIFRRLSQLREESVPTDAFQRYCVPCLALILALLHTIQTHGPNSTKGGTIRPSAVLAVVNAVVLAEGSTSSFFHHLDDTFQRLDNIDPALYQFRAAVCGEPPSLESASVGSCILKPLLNFVLQDFVSEESVSPDLCLGPLFRAISLLSVEDRKEQALLPSNSTKSNYMITDKSSSTLSLTSESWRAEAGTFGGVVFSPQLGLGLANRFMMALYQLPPRHVVAALRTLPVEITLTVEQQRHLYRVLVKSMPSLSTRDYAVAIGNLHKLHTVADPVSSTVLFSRLQLDQSPFVNQLRVREIASVLVSMKVLGSDAQLARVNVVEHAVNLIRKADAAASLATVSSPLVPSGDLVLLLKSMEFCRQDNHRIFLEAVRALNRHLLVAFFTKAESEKLRSSVTDSHLFSIVSTAQVIGDWNLNYGYGALHSIYGNGSAATATGAGGLPLLNELWKERLRPLLIDACVGNGRSLSLVVRCINLATQWDSRDFTLVLALCRELGRVGFTSSSLDVGSQDATPRLEESIEHRALVEVLSARPPETQGGNPAKESSVLVSQTSDTSRLSASSLVAVLAQIAEDVRNRNTEQQVHQEGICVERVIAPRIVFQLACPSNDAFPNLVERLSTMDLCNLLGILIEWLTREAASKSSEDSGSWVEAVLNCSFSLLVASYEVACNHLVSALVHGANRNQTETRLLQTGTNLSQISRFPVDQLAGMWDSLSALYVRAAGAIHMNIPREPIHNEIRGGTTLAIDMQLVSVLEVHLTDAVHLIQPPRLLLGLLAASLELGGIESDFQICLVKQLVMLKRFLTQAEQLAFCRMCQGSLGAYLPSELLHDVFSEPMESWTGDSSSSTGSFEIPDVDPEVLFEEMKD